MAASPSRWASTTAPTSCPTPSTTRWISSGSRATIWPSNSATSATSAAIRSSRFPSTSRGSPRLQPALAGIPIGRITATATPSDGQLRHPPALPDGSPTWPTTRAATSTSRSLHRLRGGVHRLQGGRRRRLQRAAGARRKAHEPRLQVGASYTYSHALDEQSGLGLFYNGNNPLNLRSGYGRRTSTAPMSSTSTTSTSFPTSPRKHTLAGKIIDGLVAGWPHRPAERPALQRHRLQRRIGSIYYSTYDGITNPIVPLAPGCTAKSAKTGLRRIRRRRKAALKPLLHLPASSAGGLNGAIPTTDPYETGFTTGQRNIFRQAFQKRADASLVKDPIHRALQPQVHLRRLQPHQHHQLRRSRQRSLAEQG
jgi:hypothetical protein